MPVAIKNMQTGKSDDDYRNADGLLFVRRFVIHDSASHVKANSSSTLTEQTDTAYAECEAL